MCLGGYNLLEISSYANQLRPFHKLLHHHLSKRFALSYEAPKL